MKIMRKRGSWKAVVSGHGELSVIHGNQVDWVTRKYREGGAAPTSRRWEEHAALIAQTKKVVIQFDKGPDDAARNGYWGAARVDNIQFVDGQLTFDIVERIL